MNTGFITSRPGCLTLIVFLMYCDCLLSVALPCDFLSGSVCYVIVIPWVVRLYVEIIHEL